MSAAPVRQRAFEAALALEALLARGSSEREALVAVDAAEQALLSYAASLDGAGLASLAVSERERAAQVVAYRPTTEQLQRWATRLREQALGGAA